jgi:hypothetical protein
MKDGSERLNATGYDIFVSYSHHDCDIVEKVARELAANGLHVFLDAWGLQLGESLVGRLEEAIRGSRAGLLFFSKHAADSRWVKEEYQRMISRSVTDDAFRLIPVRLDGTQLPDFAAGRKWYDLAKQTKGKIRGLADAVLASLDRKRLPVARDEAADIWLMRSRLSHKVLFTLKALDLQRRQYKSIWRIADILELHTQHPLRPIGKCECGGTIYCGYADMGVSDYYDSYFHLCAECLAHKYHYERIHQGSGDEDELPCCPWCNYTWVPTPGEIRGSST